jgi:hypothetical protein
VSVATCAEHIHETRGRSDGVVDGVAAASRRVDAIFMILKFGNGRKSRRVADLRHDEDIKTHVLQPQR